MIVCRNRNVLDALCCGHDIVTGSILGRVGLKSLAEYQCHATAISVMLQPSRTASTPQTGAGNLLEHKGWYSSARQWPQAAGSRC